METKCPVEDKNLNITEVFNRFHGTNFPFVELLRWGDNSEESKWCGYCVNISFGKDYLQKYPAIKINHIDDMVEDILYYFYTPSHFEKEASFVFLSPLGDFDSAWAHKTKGYEYSILSPIERKENEGFIREFLQACGVPFMMDLSWMDL